VATIINIDENKSQLFEMEGGGKVYLKAITSEEFNAINKKTTKKKVEYRKVDGTASRFEYEEIDYDLRAELFYDAAIIDWENFVDASGNEIPCTKENKMLFMNKSVAFSKFIADSIKILTDDTTRENEEAEKN